MLDLFAITKQRMRTMKEDRKRKELWLGAAIQHNFVTTRRQGEQAHSDHKEPDTEITEHFPTWTRQRAKRMRAFMRRTYTEPLQLRTTHSDIPLAVPHDALRQRSVRTVCHNGATNRADVQDVTIGSDRPNESPNSNGG